MNLLIFKTDLATKKKISAIRSIFDTNPVISRWTVDTEDIDNVLRIEAVDGIKEKEITRLMQLRGFYCEPLPD